MPVNGKMLQDLDAKNVILISHHGNAITEAAYLGFKTISSKASGWGLGGYRFSNTYRNLSEYTSLLKKSVYALQNPNRESLLSYIHCLNFYENNKQVSIGKNYSNTPKIFPMHPFKIEAISDEAETFRKTVEECKESFIEIDNF